MTNKSYSTSGATRILVFDCWLPGFLYIKELAEMERVSLIYVHNSESQMGQPAREYREFKARLNVPHWVKDFGEFNKDFRRLFEEVKPDIVLVTSMHYVEHRTALLFAKEYGIKRAFIPHGIFLLNQSASSSSGLSSGNIIAKIYDKIPRAYYYSILYWTCHFQRNPSTRGTLWAAFSCFYDLLRHYPDWQWRPSEKVQRYYSDLLDVALLYDQSLKEFYLKNSRGIFKDTDFIISGTLDCGKLLREIKAKPSLLQAGNNSTPHAYFISSPYPEYFTEHGAAVLAEILGRLKAIVASAGCHQLIYRAHPGEPGWFVDKVCALADLVRDTKPGNEGLIRANLICGTSSSLLYNAVLLKKPIIIISTEKIRLDLPYYEPLISYSKLVINLDINLETLIREYGVKIQAIIAPKYEPISVLATDPLESLVEYIANLRRLSL